MIQLVAWGLAAFLTYLLVDWYRRQPRISGINDKYILVTGCDSGFGNLLARRLDTMGCHVFATCLTEKGQTELRNVSSSSLHTLIMDVTDVDSIYRAYDFVRTILPKNTGLWGLVNNAGIPSVGAGPLEWLNIEDFRKVIEVNALGLVNVTLIFLPLLKRSKGRIINMSSAAGRWAGPFGVPYSMSKFGVEAFSDSLRRHLQLNSLGVSVHILEPGLFKTPSIESDCVRRTVELTWKRLNSRTKEEFGEPFYRKYVKMTLDNFKWASPDVGTVVDTYVHALTAKCPRTRYTLGWDAVVAVALSYLPTCLSDYLVYLIFQKIPLAPKRYSLSS